MFERKYRINLLFNANKVYDRQVIEGVGEYLQASQADWDIYIEEDFRFRIDRVKDWAGDGVIADFDDPEVEAALQDMNFPIVAVGGSYMAEEDYPTEPYIATDNFKLVELAFQHLKDKGFENFAFYGTPPHPGKKWARERKKAFVKLMKDNGFEVYTYNGEEVGPQSWQYALNRLADWIQRLPEPTGIVAVTDSRARHVLQVCEHLDILVPDRISVIGIDNEELTRYLNRIPLSSVGQGCKEMGYQAAKLLHRALRGGDISGHRMLIPPTKVFERQSSDYKALKDPYVIQAMHFIRMNACKGIKVDQVVDYVGISRSNLEARFKDETRQSVHNEIHNFKLYRAEHLLESTDLPIAEIASLCGYPSIQYLYTVFKKHMDITPKDYREQHRKVVE